MVQLSILRVRGDFTRLGQTKAWRSTGFTLRANTASASMKENRETTCRVGLTVSKHCSKKAVERNRIKRRLREIVREIWPKHGRSGHDYVLIARIEALNMPYDALRDDAERLLKKLHAA